MKIIYSFCFNRLIIFKKVLQGLAVWLCVRAADWFTCSSWGWFWQPRQGASYARCTYPMALALLVLIMFFSAASSYALTKIIDEAKLKVLKINDVDVVIGSKDAPITLVEYFYFGCVHCKEFYLGNYQKLYKDYIATGKVKWVKRSMAYDAKALKITLLVKCNSGTTDMYNKYMQFLFSKQNVWLGAKNYIEILENISKIAGMSGEDFHKCIEDKSLAEQATKITIDAQRVLGMYSTPTFFMNNYELDQKDFQNFEQTIEKVKKNEK